MKPRGICPECHRDVSIRKDGTLTGHGARDLYARWCQGSREKPVALVEDGLVVPVG